MAGMLADRMHEVVLKVRGQNIRVETPLPADLAQRVAQQEAQMCHPDDIWAQLSKLKSFNLI